MSEPALRGPLATLDLLRRDIQSRFGGGATPARQPPRIGAELEFLVSDEATGLPAPIVPFKGVPATLPVLRALAERHAWRERRAACGAPAFALPHGGELSFEPGGQLEYAAPAARSATALVADMRRMAALLQDALARQGLALRGLGLDPVSSIGAAPLRLSDVPRYREMDAYFATIGPAGARMMRQTASLQVSLDGADAPVEVWRVLTAAAPYALALFANSPIYERADTGHQSFRAHTWRALDPARTGLVAVSGAPDDYLSFALEAPAMLLGAPDAGYRPMREWLSGNGLSMDEWRTHVTTLFPEVRPRGHFEVRSCDAIPPRWFAAPIAFFAGLAYDPASRRAGLEALRSRDDATLLARAGASGVHDDGIRATALALFELALAGCRSLGERFIAPSLVEEAREFVDTFTASGRSLADDVLSLEAMTR